MKTICVGLVAFSLLCFLGTAAGASDVGGAAASKAMHSSGCAETVEQVDQDEALAYCAAAGILDAADNIPVTVSGTVPRRILLRLMHRAATDHSKDTARVPSFLRTVVWAAKNDILADQGVGALNSSPATREQTLYLLWRAADSPKSDTESEVMAALPVSDWAQDAVQWAQSAGLLASFAPDGKTDLKAQTTGGEVAALLYAFLGGTSQTARTPFDFESRTVTLNSGYKMPINGLGTYSLHGETAVASVKAALASSVRLIDTAHMYGNEEEIGRAIRESMEELGIPREEIFVTTKIYPGSDMQDPEAAIQACLDRLDIGYIDLMLLHHPDPNDVSAYKTMERFVADGKIRSIGLSNWYIEELEEFLPQVDTMPALVQNEIHPYYQENNVIEYIQDLGIVVQGWYPLGGRGHTRELLENDVIQEIAAAHDISAAQVILRWNLQKGVAVIPGSSNPDHIQENTELYDFELTDDEMERINELDRNEKHDWY